MIPVYIFYSMFGFQRTGDGLWAAADQMARGFLLGATAGRTTLTGEGLQHADGHSLLLASSNPAAVTYDPAFSYEIAHIFRDGLRRMYGGTDGVDGFGGENIFYYITVYNEPYAQPAEPENLDVEGLLKGVYLYKRGAESGPKAQILVSGVIMPEALRAQQMLEEEWGVSADVWSVTSWGELRRDGVECDRQALLDPGREPQVPYVASVLNDAAGPFVAVSDWMRAVPDQIRKWVPGDYTVLGADGFGFSDTRPAARRVFNIDAESTVVAVLEALGREGTIDRARAVEAAKKYRIDDVTAAPEQTSDPGVA
jgi:pyruvate dehydrogenase E1 component